MYLILMEKESVALLPAKYNNFSLSKIDSNKKILQRGVRERAYEFCRDNLDLSSRKTNYEKRKRKTDSTYQK